MNPAVFCFCATLLIFFPAQRGHAQEDTARHRAVYQKINASLKQLEKVKGIYKDDPIVFELEGWVEGRTLRKILAMVPGEDGDGSEEYYFEGGRLLFVYRTYSTPDPAKKNGARKIEDRFYFKEGRMFKWIGEDKKTVPADSADFTAEAERLTGNSAHFTAALTGKTGAGKTKQPQAGPGAVQTTEGTFSGIEEGDYAHWSMSTLDGKELSLFILRPDDSLTKVLDQPARFAGQRCRVHWKTSTENIPEAGGKTKVDQILSVEWLGKK